ncbi:MAG: T9SS type A sorting domain-containing protein [Sphingobacteriales bacterium]|nr:T9SS type A sorting domain-containing protein [Sphingobacteriales bacterium]
MILYSVQAQVLFEKDFAIKDIQNGFNLLKYKENEFWIVGNTLSWDNQLWQAYILRYDTLGIVKNTVLQNESEYESSFYAAAKGKDGNWVLIGQRNEANENISVWNTFAGFWKFDAFWYTKEIGNTSYYNFCTSIVPTEDNGFIAGGQLLLSQSDDDPLDGHYQPYIIKIDENGDKEWELIIEGYSDDNKVTDLLALPNGNFLASCLVNWQPWNSNNPSDIALIEFDESGIIIQQKLIDWEVNEVLWDLYVSDSDYIAAYNNQDSTYIMKLDLNFDVVWKSEEITNNCSIFQPMVLINGDIIAGGCYRTNLIDYALQAQIIKLNSNGELLWRRLYGGEENDYGYALLRDTDGTLWVTGRYESGLESVPVLNGQGDTLYFGGRANVYLLHTNCLGLLENPNITFQSTQNGTDVTFTADTLGFRGEPYSLWWDFGDGSEPEPTPAGTTQQHVYAQNGVYWATLNAYFCDTLSVGQCIRIGTTEQCPEEWTVGNETMPPLTGNHIAATYTAADHTLHFWAELPPCEAQLYDVSGKMVEQAQISGSRWQLPSLPQGVYFYRIFTQHSKTPLADGKFVAP